MEKVYFCKIGVLVLLFLAMAVAANPLQEAEDAITVPAVQFQSKSNDELCTGYQIRGQLYATLARCLGTERSEINKLRELDLIGQGVQKVQAFALQAENAESIGDIAVLMYAGPGGKQLEQDVDGSDLFGKFGLVPKARVERQEPGGASLAEINLRVLGAALALVGSALLK
ncbi:uncharacterized protein LOC131686186 [Topomyia yanbarensis]|uniref:uncharacterized protein LOC131686186 n=1 Tax=Topomyia yanbarensis TaxID=2498891 RepID=UPI00273BD680|nr:uncharacterized protein LOC131686186 [Topomyia yanbarensis]